MAGGVEGNGEKRRSVAPQGEGTPRACLTRTRPRLERTRARRAPRARAAARGERGARRTRQPTPGAALHSSSPAALSQCPRISGIFPCAYCSAQLPARPRLRRLRRRRPHSSVRRRQQRREGAAATLARLCWPRGTTGSRAASSTQPQAVEQQGSRAAPRARLAGPPARQKHTRRGAGERARNTFRTPHADASSSSSSGSSLEPAAAAGDSWVLE